MICHNHLLQAILRETLCFPFVFFWFVLFLLPLSSFLRFFSYSIQMLVEFVLMPLINCTLAPLFVPLLFSLSLALVVYLLCSPVDSHVSNWSRPDFCFRPCTLRGGLTAQPNDDGISAVDDVTCCLFSVIRTLNPVQKGCIRLFVTEVLQLPIFRVNRNNLLNKTNIRSNDSTCRWPSDDVPSLF